MKTDAKKTKTAVMIKNKTPLLPAYNLTVKM